jgi:hypothetical protein
MIDQSVADSGTPSTREEKALDLWRNRRHEIERIGEDRYLVPACSARGGFYVVDYADETCTCPDAEFHPGPCKHLLAVALCFAKRRRPKIYSETVEAARREAAPSYREETRRMMRAGIL